MNIEADYYFTLSSEWDSKEVGDGSFCNWRQGDSSIAMKYVFIYAFVPDVVSQHLFPSPLDSRRIRRGPIYPHPPTPCPRKRIATRDGARINLCITFDGPS